eukprot:CAMPEP_0115244204 /NCGR_PEP_ID=MMETSP0270-20121206/39868_1 /TAXON_ID=71861 /ORGANISM="Scrippsiella trochoidea, Strain CCMP3099" /LENGTH=30 /DNA_ID= /DNA_START= /DNA_END= /DNA_ORIENTATION=
MAGGRMRQPAAITPAALCESGLWAALARLG